MIIMIENLLCDLQEKMFINNLFINPSSEEIKKNNLHSVLGYVSAEGDLFVLDVPFSEENLKEFFNLISFYDKSAFGGHISDYQDSKWISQFGILVEIKKDKVNIHPSISFDYLSSEALGKIKKYFSLASIRNGYYTFNVH